MFSWEINAERNANALPQDVWKIWENVPNWPSWDSDLEWSRLDGPFAEGTKGSLKPKGWFSSEFTISEVKINDLQSNASYMPFTTLVFTHQVKKINNSQVKIIHNMRVSGLLAPLLWLTMRFKLRNAIPEALENLVKKVEKSV